MTLVIQDEVVRVDSVADRNTSVVEALAYFPEYECRYIIWDVDVEVKEGREYSKVSSLQVCLAFKF